MTIAADLGVESDGNAANEGMKFFRVSNAIKRFLKGILRDRQPGSAA